MSSFSWIVLAFVALGWMAVPTDSGFTSELDETEMMAMSDGTPPPPPQ